MCLKGVGFSRPRLLQNISVTYTCAWGVAGQQIPRFSHLTFFCQKIYQIRESVFFSNSVYFEDIWEHCYVLHKNVRNDTVVWKEKNICVTPKAELVISKCGKYWAGLKIMFNCACPAKERFLVIPFHYLVSFLWPYIYFEALLHWKICFFRILDYKVLFHPLFHNSYWYFLFFRKFKHV